MITNLHHVAILTFDMDQAIEFYSELLDCPASKVVEVNEPGIRLRSAMLPIGPGGTTYLQILEPKEGPGVKELAEGGEGTLFEMAFQVDDAEALANRMLDQGVVPCDIAEKAIEGKYITSKFGNRYYILPASAMRGTRIEIVQVMDTESNTCRRTNRAC